MKYIVSSVVSKNGIDTIEIKGSKYIFTIPQEAGIKEKQKININISGEREDVPSKNIVELYAQVFRVLDDHCLASAGGLVCKIHGNYLLDQNLFIALS